MMVMLVGAPGGPLIVHVPPITLEDVYEVWQAITRTVVVALKDEEPE